MKYSLIDALRDVDQAGYQQVFDRFYVDEFSSYSDTFSVYLPRWDDDAPRYNAIGAVYHLITGENPKGWDALPENIIITQFKEKTGIDLGKTRYLSGCDYPLYRLGRFSLFKILFSLENTHGQRYDQIAEWLEQHPR